MTSKCFRRKIRKMVDSIKYTVWVGITDLDREGEWKFVTDKTVFDPNKGKTLYRWAAGEPNNQNRLQHCACIWYRNEKKNDLDDDMCWKEKWGLCEIKK